jgi:hypothetical protein
MHRWFQRQDACAYVTDRVGVARSALKHAVLVHELRDLDDLVRRLVRDGYPNSAERCVRVCLCAYTRLYVYMCIFGNS